MMQAYVHACMHIQIKECKEDVIFVHLLDAYS